MISCLYYLETDEEKNTICKSLQDEDSSVTDHFENRRLSKRSVTSKFFLYSESTSLFLGRPRVTTLAIMIRHHYWLRLFLVIFISKLRYISGFILKTIVSFHGNSKVSIIFLIILYFLARLYKKYSGY